MLCLNRFVGQSVIITMPDGRRIRVCVVSYRRNSMRLGIEAPDDIMVNREEIQDRIDRESGRAAPPTETA